MIAALRELANWWPNEPIPSGLSSTTIDEAAQGFRLLLEPATEAQFKVAIGLLVRHAQAYNIATDDDALDASYRQSCASMPGDLLVHGISSILDRWDNTYRLPTPALVWEFIGRAFDQRQKDLDLVLSAKAKLDLEKPKPPEPPAADLDEYIAETKRILAETIARTRF